jgi:hypothetical protein
MRFARAVRVQPELLSSHSTLNDALEAIASRRTHPAGSGSVEFYSPPEFIESARCVVGTFDLDPASCEQAQQVVQARRYYTVDDDGLTKEWAGRIWCNPPYKDAGRFVDKLLHEISAGRVTEAFLLCNSYTEVLWFQRALAACALVCFPPKRVLFQRPNDEEPTRSSYGSAIFYFGDSLNRFREAFASHGIIARPDTGDVR